MTRHITIQERDGIFFADGNTIHGQARTLEGLLEKLDPGNEPAAYAKAAGILNKALGPKREGDHGSIKHGLVGT